VDQASSVVVHRSQCIDNCHNMASYGVDSDAAEQKDSIQKSVDDEICQTPAKRLKISDGSFENAVGVSSKFQNITLSFCLR